MQLKLAIHPTKTADRLWPEIGVYLPADLNTHSSMAYVMNQEPGRLRIRDIKCAIEDKKAELEQVNQGLRLIAEECASIDALDDEEINVSVKVRSSWWYAY